MCSLGNEQLSGINFTQKKSLFSPQDLERCDPKGRDCIERNFAETFNCSTTCVGINADVQWVGKMIDEEVKEEKIYGTKKGALEGNIHDDLLERFLLLEEEMKLMKEEMKLMKNGLGQVMKIATGQKGEEVDRKKYNMLISEYKKFKTKNVKHFRFNSAANMSKFGKSKFAQKPNL